MARSSSSVIYELDHVFSQFSEEANIPSLIEETPGCWACEEIGAALEGVF